jgi:cytochrome c biogenesis protein ResB
MFKMIVFLVLMGMVVLLFLRRTRHWLLEQLKAASDTVVIFFLRSTSQFGSELTEDGKTEQKLWREQRLRNLQGLALRSKQRWQQKTK